MKRNATPTILTTMLLILSAGYGVYAQQPDTSLENTIKMKIITDVDGEQQVIEKEFNSWEAAQADADMGDLSIDMDNLLAFVENEEWQTRLAQLQINEDDIEKKVQQFQRQIKIELDSSYDFSGDSHHTLVMKFDQMTPEDLQVILNDEEGLVNEEEMAKQLEKLEILNALNEEEAEYIHAMEANKQQNLMINGMPVMLLAGHPNVWISEYIKDEPEFADYEMSNNKALKLEGLEVQRKSGSALMQLKFTVKARPTEVRIIDTNKNLRYLKNYKDFNGSFREDIDLNKFEPGVYLLQVMQGNQVANRKMVIEE